MSFLFANTLRFLQDVAHKEMNFLDLIERLLESV